MKACWITVAPLVVSFALATSSSLQLIGAPIAGEQLLEAGSLAQASAAVKAQVRRIGAQFGGFRHVARTEGTCSLFASVTFAYLAAVSGCKVRFKNAITQDFTAWTFEFLGLMGKSGEENALLGEAFTSIIAAMEGSERLEEIWNGDKRSENLVQGLETMASFYSFTQKGWELHLEEASAHASRHGAFLIDERHFYILSNMLSCTIEVFNVESESDSHKHFVFDPLHVTPMMTIRILSYNDDYHIIVPAKRFGHQHLGQQLTVKEEKKKVETEAELEAKTETSVTDADPYTPLVYFIPRGDAPHDGGIPLDRDRPREERRPKDHKKERRPRDQRDERNLKDRSPKRKRSQFEGQGPGSTKRRRQEDKK